MPLLPPPETDAHSLRLVDRARVALRCGEPVAIDDGTGRIALVLAVETLTAEALARLRRLTGSAPVLALTRWRAAAVGLLTSAGPGVVTLTPAIELGVGGIHALVEPGRRPPATDRIASTPSDAAETRTTIGEADIRTTIGEADIRTTIGEADTRTTIGEADIRTTIGEADAHAVAAVRLTKLAALLPTAVMAMVGSDHRPDPAWCQHHDLRLVTDGAIADYQRQAARALRPVAEARVPLVEAPDARIIAFRPSNGGHEHLAIVIGEPKAGEPVLVRLHSECFTGDLLGSLRCDCGDQLRRAIAEISTLGSGIVLYLAQEGRGIGLVNKLRAYQLQDQGYDTLDANERLGFDADERLYLPAAEMLRRLGFDRVRLMTNNPDKMAQLARCGIDVVERVPHVIPSNDHNEAYLRTKAQRGGHLF
jgi:GTP cyclohydrolase II